MTVTPTGMLLDQAPTPDPTDLVTRVRRSLRPRTRLVELGRRLRRSRLGTRTLHNLLVDVRFGGWCGGREENPFAPGGAFPIQSIDYAILARLHRWNGLAVAPDDVLVDVGCGKGRVLNWWLSRRLPNRLIGLELVPDVARATSRRLQRFPNVEIRPGDAIAQLPAEGTFFFLYSPFDRAVMCRFRDALRSKVRRALALRVLYFNSRYVEVFREDPHWRIRTLRSGEAEPAALITPA